MPAPFLIAQLISLSLIGTPATDSRLPRLDPAQPSSAEALAVETLDGAEVLPSLAEQPPVDQLPVEQPLAGISVELECLAYPDGYVANCAVLSETRPGLGFGEAAVALMNGTSASPDVRTGRTAPVKFRHTIEFTPD